MGLSRKAYPREFREEAVRLIRESRKPVKQMARDLGVSYESLRTWIKRADLDAGRRTDGLTTEERDELRCLRRENRILQEEREILKEVAHAGVPAPATG
ncbi:MAG TPA: transposase [Chloroflexota bacterium]|jgi:transposase